MFLERLEHAVEDTRRRPTAQPRVDRVPVAKPLWQRPPFAAILGDEENRIDDIEIGDPHVAPLHGQQRADHFILVFGQAHHARSLHELVPGE
jgi:hypothetical protein